MPRWHLDIDRYLNPVVAPSILPRLPYPIAHFCGYRTEKTHRSIPLGNLIVVFWSVIGIFATLSLIGLIGQNVPSFESNGVPVIVGSFGAAAVLDFYAIESPLAQPRNAIVGQLIASVTGVSICRLFMLSSNFESIRWVGGALSCAVATGLMALTGTVHPPAGATALMAVADDQVAKLGWFLIPVVMLGCGVMLLMALLVNNIQRRFPVYWWTPETTGEYWCREVTPGERPSVETSHDNKSAACASTSSGDLEMATSIEDQPLVITKGLVQVPRNFYLSIEEKKMLETLSLRL
ncbi:HPP family-domain-containing protein [Rhypophila decipiens]|uniref:HPP family-domain-containing protein n=1 Tax=Rhypophila decipiens TaxID=261697 RepID=A0AAN6XWC4_9PEZI|nr:HPP family-domain-containing protein [Rhypophila decipiens]